MGKMSRSVQELFVVHLLWDFKFDGKPRSVTQKLSPLQVEPVTIVLYKVLV